jgi:glycosyltransferase involved in cell wall biosynthesis
MNRVIQIVRVKLWAKDVLYKYGMGVVGVFFYLAFKVLRLVNKKTLAFSCLLKAHRAMVTGRYALSHSQLERNVKENLQDIIERVDVDKQEGINELHWILIRSLILKPARFVDGQVIEKGVLLITFTTTFALYLQRINCAALLKHYRVVLEPSWSGYCVPEILKWTQYTDAIIVEASEISDRTFLKNLSSNLIPVDFGSSDWVDYRIFKPLALPKEYDAIYVASYTWIKRAHVYFKALKEIKRRGLQYKALLVCGRRGADKDEILLMVKFYQIEDVLDIVEEASPAYLNELLNKSKVNILLTHKEGSNRSIFEAFFAGTPGIVLKHNVGVNKNYINEQTGSLIDENQLADTLLYYKDHWHEYQPQLWAKKHISPDVTSDKLNTLLITLAKQQGEPWTQDIVVKVNSPEAVLMYPDAGTYSQDVMQVQQLKAYLL